MMGTNSYVNRVSDLAAPVARIMFAALFFNSGLSKLLNPEVASNLMTNKGVPFVGIVLAATVAIELIASIAVVVGYQARWAGLLLFLWLIPVTLIFHNFWATEAAQFNNQRTHFMKNLAIMGGALFIFINGAGAFSIDNLRRGSRQ